jgi:predicted HicB family RNase H-like nuclease
MKEVIELSNDAKREWFKAALDSGISIKKPHEDYSGQLRLRMPKSLHRILSLKAAEEGISLNQLVVYELGKSVANY